MKYAVVFNPDINILTCQFCWTKLLRYLSDQPDYYSITKDDLYKGNFPSNKPPEIVLSFENMKDIHEANIPEDVKIYIILDDLHHAYCNPNNIINSKKVYGIFTMYAYCYDIFYPKKQRVYLTPHAVTFTRDFNEKPIEKVLLSGRMNKSVYPFRQIVLEKSKKSKDIDRLVPNVSYRLNKRTNNEKSIYGQKYVDYLGKYLACFTCDLSEQRPYLVCKHFEIMASGSLLLAGNMHTKQIFEELGFIDMEHYVAVTIENFDEKVKYVLDPKNRELIDKIRRKGYELAKEKHTYLHRARFIDSVIRGKENVEEKTYNVKRGNSTKKCYYLAEKN